MSKHTPGPWRYQREVEIAPGRAQIVRFNIYNVSGPFANPAECGNEDDARLIVTAPEMLALLKRINERYLLPVGAGPGPEIADLIAKAEGRK